MKVKASEVVAIARSQIGVPYGHQGRVAGLSLDCAGLPVHVAKTLGIPLTDYTRYGRTPVPAEMRSALDAHLERVPTEQIAPGDVVWMRSRYQREPHHLGIVADYCHGGLSLIHATNDAGLNKVVEHRIDDTWRARIVAAWRYPGVEA